MYHWASIVATWIPVGSKSSVATCTGRTKQYQSEHILPRSARSIKRYFHSESTNQTHHISMSTNCVWQGPRLTLCSDLPARLFVVVCAQSCYNTSCHQAFMGQTILLKLRSNKDARDKFATTPHIESFLQIIPFLRPVAV